MAAIGEGTIGAARGARDFVYLTVSTGVGGAIVSGGRMVRGATNTAGELGHFPVGMDKDVRCRCGSFGCVEAYAAGRNIAEAYGAAEASIVYAKAAAGDARAVTLIARAVPRPRADAPGDRRTRVQGPCRRREGRAIGARRGRLDHWRSACRS